MIPGELIPAEGDITLNAGAEALSITAAVDRGQRWREHRLVQRLE